MNFKSGILTFLLFTSFLVPCISAQEDVDSIPGPESIEKVKKGSIFAGRPGKSLLMSLVVPGSGQIYNKSYLRVPFVWGAVGGAGYYMFYTQRNYNCFRDAYIAKIDNKPVVLDEHCLKQKDDFDVPIIPQLSAPTLRLNRDKANKDRQTAILIFSLVWLANGVDAFVDAHLKDFDIDEDLSIDIGPRISDDAFAPMQLGIYVQFK